jgi:hypothetical protein
MQDSKSTDTSFAIRAKLIKSIIDDILVDPKLYQQKIGSIIYEMLSIKPDIAFAVS